MNVLKHNVNCTCIPHSLSISTHETCIALRNAVSIYKCVHAYSRWCVRVRVSVCEGFVDASFTVTVQELRAVCIPVAGEGALELCLVKNVPSLVLETLRPSCIITVRPLFHQTRVYFHLYMCARVFVSVCLYMCAWMMCTYIYVSIASMYRICWRLLDCLASSKEFGGLLPILLTSCKFLDSWNTFAFLAIIVTHSHYEYWFDQGIITVKLFLYQLGTKFLGF